MKPLLSLLGLGTRCAPLGGLESARYSRCHCFLPMPFSPHLRRRKERKSVIAVIRAGDLFLAVPQWDYPPQSRSCVRVSVIGG